MLTAGQVRQHEEQGYLVVPRLFSSEEVAALREHYMRLRERGTYPGDFAGVDPTSADPLKRFPRMIHMHRWDDVSLRWMIDARLNACLTQLLGVEPFAVQTMLYFKPPGARGQALHQDQYYLCTEPGTCMAAWLTLDDADEENGCMQVVPGSHRLPVLCTEAADIRVSFTDIQVPVPDSVPVAPVPMKAGDVLFFNGSLIHGSYPNTSKDRFRRALIGHYVTGEARKVAQFYHPALRMDGAPVDLEVSERGGPCGTWSEVRAESETPV
jgi:ectoine hydroxylase-related dioxygenase (phytanoyl-CoA dioxygenase family)